MFGRSTVKLILFRLPDIFLLVLIAVMAVAAFISFKGGPGSFAEVYVRNKKAASFNLSDPDQLKKISTEIGELEIRYGEGAIRVVKSPCPQRICIRQGTINKTQEQIICVPARVIIRIVNAGTLKGPVENIDAVTH